MKYKHFSVEEREKIQQGLWEKKSYREIARDLGRSVSSISREVRRVLPAETRRYSPRLANVQALENRKRRGREDHLKNAFIREYVVTHLKRRWSPEQIAGRLRVDHPGFRISHEAIYQFIYDGVSRANSLPYIRKEDLRIFLKRRHRLRTHHGARHAWRMARAEVPSIDIRPHIVEERSRIGDWEGDTVESVGHKPGINTLVERRSGLVCITKLFGKTARDTSAAVAQRLGEIPSHLRLTLTVDNGSENSDWKYIQETSHTKMFFAHAYHSWERGTNENTNGLIRHYFPKKTDFTMISEMELSHVEQELNARPRKRLGWRTPEEVFRVALQS